MATTATDWTTSVLTALDRGAPVVRAVLLGATASSPRQPGSDLIITATTVEGDFGGTLHATTVARARQLLADPATTPWRRDVMHHNLNPVMDQPSAGVSRVLLEVFGPREARALTKRSGPVVMRPLVPGAPLEWAGSDTLLAKGLVPPPLDQLLGGARPLALFTDQHGAEWVAELVSKPLAELIIYGDGKVAAALAKISPGLPFVLRWLAGRTPEEMVATAKGSSNLAFHVITTGNHAWDYQIVHALLQRDAVAYLGMIGAATKRHRLTERLAEAGVEAARMDLIRCPIGLPDIRGKEPAVIALSIAAEMLTVLRPFDS